MFSHQKDVQTFIATFIATHEFSLNFWYELTNKNGNIKKCIKKIIHYFYFLIFYEQYIMKI